VKVEKRFVTKDGKCYGYDVYHKVTLREFRVWAKEKQKDDTVVKTYAIYFDGWHHHQKDIWIRDSK